MRRLLCSTAILALITLSTNAHAQTILGQPAEDHAAIIGNASDVNQRPNDGSRPIRIGNNGVMTPIVTAHGADGRRPAMSDKEVQRLADPNGNGNNAEPNEFQKFVRDTTGKMLPMFGAEFFNGNPSTFAPLQNTPIPSDYRLGPGDEILIRGWGSIEIDYRAIIDRNGLITIPTIGSIPLHGMKVNEVEELVRGAVAKLYKGVNINVSFGQIKAITIYVVGQARRPGTYTVSGLSTLVTALFSSGGANANGSLRRVQIKRAEKIAAELDLYDFIAKGNKAADIRLQDGDTIFIPPASGFVALVGNVNTPAIYELRSVGDSISTILDYAGGLPVTADPKRAFLERIDPSLAQPRRVEQFALDAAGLSRVLKSGDLLNITSITPEFSNAVILRGNVEQSIRAPFREGMRISDLIPNKNYLVTRSSLLRKNNANLSDATNSESGDLSHSLAARIGDLGAEINWEYAVVERMNKNDLSVTLLNFNLGKLLDNPNGPDNLLLERGDVITIFSQSDVRVPRDKRKIFVRIEGEVQVPGVYQMAPSETLIGLIAKAGGPTKSAYLFGVEFYRDQVRKEQQANMDKVIRRLESQIQGNQAKSAASYLGRAGTSVEIAEGKLQAEAMTNKATLDRLRNLRATGRISFKLDPAGRSFNSLPALRMENGDQLIVPARPEFIHIYGAVNQESSVLWQPGVTVGRYLSDAGTTSEADMDSVFVLRADGSVMTNNADAWIFSSITSREIMPGDSIVVPERGNRETLWTKFTSGAKDWAQIFSGFGLGAAAIKSLRGN